MDTTISHPWLYVKPHVACASDYLGGVDEKTAAIAMSQNLRALRAARPEFRGQLKVAKKAGVGEGTVGRARRGDGNLTLNVVERIARAYRLEAWQLIRPGYAVKPEDGSPSLADEGALLLFYRSLNSEGQSSLMSVAMSLYKAQRTSATIAERDLLSSDPEISAMTDKGPEHTDVPAMSQESYVRRGVREIARSSSDSQTTKESPSNAGKTRPIGRAKKVR